MSIEQPSPTDSSKASGWPSAEVWLLGALAVFGLIGFVVAFGLVMMRTAANPQALPRADAPAGMQQPVTGPQALPQ